jgi:RimJ/RimL family protein N-acetyltransferase
VFTPDLPVVTERLSLRSYTTDDLAAYYDARSRPKVVRYLYEEPMDLEQCREKLDQLIAPAFTAEGDWITLAVARRDTGEVIGDVSAKYASITHRSVEIGWVFHPDHHGQGFATEATIALIRLVVAGVSPHRIVARCDARNEASERLMRRLGMRHEGTLRESEWVKGEWTDDTLYALLEHEWADLIVAR